MYFSYHHRPKRNVALTSFVLYLLWIAGEWKQAGMKLVRSLSTMMFSSLGYKFDDWIAVLKMHNRAIMDSGCSVCWWSWCPQRRLLKRDALGTDKLGNRKDDRQERREANCAWRKPRTLYSDEGRKITPALVTPVACTKGVIYTWCMHCWLAATLLEMNAI